MKNICKRTVKSSLKVFSFNPSKIIANSNILTFSKYHNSDNSKNSTNHKNSDGNYNYFNNPSNSEFVSSIKEIKKILINELDYEKQNYNPPLKQDISSFLKSTEFVLYEIPYSPYLTLIKDTPKYNISIHFKAKEPLTISDPLDKTLDKANINDIARLTEIVNHDEINQVEKEDLDAYNIQIKVLNKQQSLNKKKTIKKKTNKSIYDKLKTNNMTIEDLEKELNLDIKNYTNDQEESKQEEVDDGELIKGINNNTHVNMFTKELLNENEYNVGFYFEGNYKFGELVFNHVYVGDDVHGAHREVVENVELIFRRSYVANHWTKLNYQIRNNFMEFLSELGINGEIIEFIEVISQDKDQRLYMKWLDEVNKFLI